MTMSSNIEANLLVSPLNTAITAMQSCNISILITKQLDLKMSALRNKTVMVLE